MASKNKIAVIGAGLGGLSAAVRLAGKGYDVHVYERSGKPGGKAASIEVSGYRFDTGPSVLTMPFVLKELFDEAGEKIEDHLTIRPMDITCKYFYPDGTELNAYSDPEKFKREAAEKTGEEEEAIKRYFAYCKKIYDLTAGIFLFESLSEISTFMNMKALKTLFNLHAIDSFRSMHVANSKFFRKEKIIQLFDRYATYNGSSPYLAPATLNIIPHVELTLGSYYIREGIKAIPESLAAVGVKKGVKFHYGSLVDKILYDGSRVTGIRASGEEISYDAVISNSDVNNTYKYLLDDSKSYFARRYARHEPSSSALVFCWGIRNTHKNLQAHNILFSENYEKEFSQLFGSLKCPDDPTVYIHISSKYRPEDAPAGSENWFVMINAPHNSGRQDWDEEKKRIRDIIIKKISRMLGAEINPLIECEQIITPEDIEISTGSFKGSIYGISSNSRFSAFMRQSNRSGKYKGLFFAGGSAHPGGGIPLVILSGKLACRMIEKRK